MCKMLVYMIYDLIYMIYMIPIYDTYIYMIPMYDNLLIIIIPILHMRKLRYVESN